MIDKRYKIIEEIGSGNIGKILKVVDLFSRDTVALKVLLRYEPEYVKRFKDEFLLLKKLHHPNIVQVFDFGLGDERELYFTLEYIPTVKWEEYLQPLNFEKLYLLLLELLSTLDFLHSKKIIHGDIKPSNILILPEVKDQVRIKFTDFGFAECEEMANPSWWKGTLPYLAPEIIRGEKPTMQSDLYSIGVLIYENLFGKTPFDDENPMDLAKSHLEKDVIIPKAPPLPIGLKNLILKLLEKDPLDRFFSAGEVEEQVQKLSGIRPDKSGYILTKSLIDSADFVGRSKALFLLKDNLARVAKNGNRFVLITGEKGIGKTRLVDEFSARSQIEGITTLRVSLKDTISREKLQDIVFQFLESSTATRIVVFEYLEKAQTPFFDFLPEYVSNTKIKNTLVCFTLAQGATDSEEDRKAIKIENLIRRIYSDSLEEMRLDHLTETETYELLGSMFDWKANAEGLSATVHQETSGNPWLIYQCMDSLAQMENIHRVEEKWILTPQDVEKVRIPHRVKDEFESRTAHLNPNSTELLDYISVWGEEIDLANLKVMTGFTEEILIFCLKEVRSHDLLRPVQDSDREEVSLVNNLFSRYIYDRIDPRKRGMLHRKAGEILEKWNSPPAPDHIFQLANHFYLAGDKETALRYSLAAARQAEKESNHHQAVVQYTQALELVDQVLPHPPITKEEILESLADQFDLTGESNRSIRLLEEALGIRELKDSDHQRSALLQNKIGKIYEKTARHDLAVKSLEKSLEQSKTSSPKQRATTLIELGWVYLRESRYQEAQERFNEALNLLEKEIKSWEMGSVLSALGSLYMTQGDYVKANQCYDDGLRVFQQFGKLQMISSSYSNLALIARLQGNIGVAIEYFQKCLSLQESFQDQYRLSMTYNNLSLAYLDSNLWDKSLEYLQRAFELMKKTADPIGLGLTNNNIGFIHLRRGELSLALEYFDQSIAQFRSARYKRGVALVYYNLGDLYANREELERAWWYLNKSLKIRKELGEEAGIADCLEALGKISIQQSNYDQAQSYLFEARSLYRKQATAKAEIQVELDLAELTVKSGKLGKAEGHLKHIRSFLDRNDIKPMEAAFLRIRACLVKAEKDYHSSLLLLDKSAKIYKELHAKLELGRIYMDIGLIKLEMGRYKEAKGYLTEASNIFEQTEVKPKLKEVSVLLERMENLRSLDQERISTFYQLAELLNTIWDTDELLTKSLELIIRLLNAERGAIIFYSEKDKKYEVKVSQGIERETSQDAIAISRQVLKDVVQSDSPLIVEDARKDARFAKSQSVIIYNILSILCVPLKTKNRLIGTVYLDHRKLPAMFSSGDVEFLKAFANLIATSIEKSELYVRANEEIFQLKEVLHQTYEFPGIVGKSAKMQEVFNTVEKVAYSKASVMILGENGTGKELIANLIHTRSPRNNGTFVKVNCAALPETLLESELFGIEDKTATGVGFRKGKFELADAGTIFLDEIGDMSLSVQAKVLRVMQEKEFERVGGQKSIKVDIRLISATNMDLEKKIESGLFRTDLYFRLNPIVINIPPLRERKEDIPLLIDYFLKKHSEDNRKPVIRISKRIIEQLKDYSWPGNVRELEHLIESAILLSEDGSFPEKLLSKEVNKDKSMINLDRYGKLKEVLTWVEKKKILHTLEKNGWNQTKTAIELGITEPTLRRRMKIYKIKRALRISSS